MTDDNFKAAFEMYRARVFGAYAEYPIDAYTHFGAGWQARGAISREMLVTAAAEAGALYEALKTRGRDDTYLSATELIIQIKVGGTQTACRRLLDLMLNAKASARDRARLHRSIWTIEQALGLPHTAATIAAHAAAEKGAGAWHSYVDTLRHCPANRTEGG